MVGVSSRPSKNSKAVREYKATGNKAMQQGAFSKAMRMYTKALELDAGNAILYSNRSAAHFNTRQFSESLEDAESAILCDSMWWKAYKRKGLALIHMQRYEEAIQALEEGLTIVGKNAEMEKNLEFAKACQEQAQNLYILPEPHMMQRLESVPVFIVTDNVGQPFFVTYDDGQQVCTFYFDKEDAVATLDWIKSENPSLGDTARVIHITLHQAFNLAQETQKQYYEETTRAAAEEDRRSAQATDKKGKEVKIGTLDLTKPTIEDAAPAVDVDGSENGDDLEEAKDDDEKDDDVKVDDIKDDNVKDDNEKGDDVKDDDVKVEEIKEVAEADAGEASDSKGDVSKDSEKKEGDIVNVDGNADDAIIDENAPLSFQFRPELRQVQVAVELLNKNPNPPVRPILRDPPSVRKAKAKAKADASAKELTGDEAEKEDGDVEKVDKAAEEKTSDSETVEEKTSDPETVEEKTSEDKTTDNKTTDEKSTEEKVEGATETEDGEAATGNGTGASRESAGEGNTGEDASDEAGKDEDMDKYDGLMEDDEDVELTVDNFNGIPIFQAKGLTLLQKNKQLIPLFFSKWDLEAAWGQLKSSNAMDVPGECDIEVGTLEDVLRRMSESKTEEFESVFFVPSRESMKAINVKFPLDELSAGTGGAGRKGVVKKAEFSKAKQIAARGGSKEEIREAIREDLDKFVERQKMAEVVSQIEHARRVSGVGGIGGVGLGGASATASASAGAGVEASGGASSGSAKKSGGASGSASGGGASGSDGIKA